MTPDAKPDDPADCADVQRRIDQNREAYHGALEALWKQDGPQSPEDRRRIQRLHVAMAQEEEIGKAEIRLRVLAGLMQPTAETKEFGLDRLPDLGADLDHEAASASLGDDAFAALSVGGLLAHVEQRLEGGVEHLPTGWPRLDAALGGGFLVPSLNVIGAPPKAHKSTFAQVIATHHVERGGVSYYLDVENGRLRFLRRLLCRRAGLGSAASPSR